MTTTIHTPGPWTRTKYPRLQEAAVRIANRTCEQINETAATCPDEGMPYKQQCILEMVIRILEERV